VSFALVEENCNFFQSISSRICIDWQGIVTLDGTQLKYLKVARYLIKSLNKQLFLLSGQHSSYALFGITCYFVGGCTIS